jgi:hypothetical protein
MEEALKKCSVCSEVKTKDNFYKDSRSKDGLSCRCKCCQAIRASEYRSLNRERIRISQKKYYDSNKEDINNKLKIRHRLNPKINMLATAKHRAKQKGLPFNLTYDDIDIPLICPILNIPISVSDDESSDASPSLDKIIPELGYVVGNIQVISKLANTMKSNANIEQLLAFAKWINKEFNKEYNDREYLQKTK